jgi:hypothetical protein
VLHLHLGYLVPPPDGFKGLLATSCGITENPFPKSTETIATSCWRDSFLCCIDGHLTATATFTMPQLVAHAMPSHPVSPPVRFHTLTPQPFAGPSTYFPPFSPTVPHALADAAVGLCQLRLR